MEHGVQREGLDLVRVTDEFCTVASLVLGVRPGPPASVAKQRAVIGGCN